MRPRIAVLGRFAARVDVLRHPGVVISRPLAETIWRAGAEPLTLLPVDSADGLDWGSRLAGVDGVLMPGGGDVDPACFGAAEVHPEVYGVDPVQDATDISLIRWAVEREVPMLAICRGFQVLNVALGGTLEQHFEQPHRHQRHHITVQAEHALVGVSADRIDVSCHHHQRVERLADGLTAVAWADDGTVEAAVAGPSLVAVQWHPEDIAASDSAQQGIVDAFVQRIHERAS
ncbi:MAG: type 1 glutamine amidotransferase [Actinomycetales bacterium]|nr:type 1 glutamine amidotransferase [Actinomycetales bacterium]